MTATLVAEKMGADVIEVTAPAKLKHIALGGALLLTLAATAAIVPAGQAINNYLVQNKLTQFERSAISLCVRLAEDGVTQVDNNEIPTSNVLVDGQVVGVLPKLVVEGTVVAAPQIEAQFKLVEDGVSRAIHQSRRVFPYVFVETKDKDTVSTLPVGFPSEVVASLRAFGAKIQREHINTRRSLHHILHSPVRHLISKPVTGSGEGDRALSQQQAPSAVKPLLVLTQAGPLSSADL